MLNPAMIFVISLVTFTIVPTILIQKRIYIQHSKDPLSYNNMMCRVKDYCKGT
jgi:hypothetical protein